MEFHHPLREMQGIAQPLIVPHDFSLPPALPLLWRRIFQVEQIAKPKPTSPNKTDSGHSYGGTILVENRS